MRLSKVSASKEEKSDSTAYEVKRRRYKLAKLRQKRQKLKVEKKREKWTKKVPT